MKKLIALSVALGLTTLLGACEPGTQQPDTGAPTDGTAPPAGEPTTPPAEPGQ
ncbi:beta-Ig-H3/fasciclin [Pleurocapsales cyanobacterium LEGE 06147]|nr:beta-Ig-H3/fasciclin [Pleurocapsales cyanobacterium LEGE 06147]